MLKKSRLYFSAMVAAMVLVSLLVTTNVKACEDPPQTLLSLYMNSDLIILAKYDSNGEAKKTNEDEYGYSLETERNLSVIKVLKGQKDLETVSFMFSEYHSNPNQEVSEGDMEDYHGGEENYFDVSKIKMGSQYLFFLKMNSETGKYDITDYVSGAKDVAGKSGIYEKSLDELRGIAENKENQMARLSEWIVKNLEDAELREDSIRDLSDSFHGMMYQEEDPNLKDQQGPFVINEGYGVYTVGVAKNLSQSQKARISSVLYPMLQEAWFAAKPEYADYGISVILGSINKPRLAMHAFNMLQSVGKEDLERKRVIMEFLSGVVEDSELTSTYYEYLELEEKINEEKAKTTPEAKKQLKTMIETRSTLLKNFDKRFKFMLDRNFVPVEVKEVVQEKEG